MSYNIYSRAFKDEVGRLALQGTSASELVKIYGVSDSSIFNWKKQYAQKQAQAADRQEPEEEPPCAQCRVDMKRHYRTRMKELRQERDLSQTEVGRVLGIQQTAYARYERGTIEIPIRNLLKLCKYYGVSSDYMLCVTNKRNHKK